MGLQNLKDAGRILPEWSTAAFLSVGFLAVYFVTLATYGNKPSPAVATACGTAILLSLGLGLALVIRRIMRSKSGEVAKALNEGISTCLNLTWTTSCFAFVVYVAWNPAITALTNNAMIATSLGIAALIIGAGYMVAMPAKRKSGEAPAANTSLALSPSFAPTIAQQPTFQVTIADLTRLICHQAGRAIGYSGSQVLFDDSFSLELDANERIARVYSNTNLINTSEFLYWRLHMLMMGSAAEQVLTGSSSQVAVDDLTSFDKLASDYLTLRSDRTFNASPINIHEAQIKAARISTLRKNVYDRCHAACASNKQVLVELVKLMRTRSVLTYGDIRSQLERVQMPEGFPIASFVDEDVLLQSLLSYEADEEVTLEGASYQHESKVDTAPADFETEPKPVEIVVESRPDKTRPANDPSISSLTA